MILVGALVLAVVLVGIALVLNSAIYAENIATRANQEDPGEARALQQQAVTGAGASFGHLHRNNSSHTSYGELEADFENSIHEWSSLYVRDSARQGRYVSTKYQEGSAVNGTLVRQTDGGEFVPRNESLLDFDSTLAGVTSWVAAPNVTSMRDHRLTVEREELVEQDQATAEVYLTDIGTGGNSVSASARPFAMVYIDEADHSVLHSVAIYEADDDDDEVKLTYRDYTAGQNRTCEIEDAETEFEVDVSGGAVEGADGECGEVFDFLSGLSDEYQLSYSSGSAIEGDYQFVVAQNNSQFKQNYDEEVIDQLDLSLSTVFSTLLPPLFEDYYEPHAPHGDTYDPAGDPYVERALYSANVTLSYRSADVSYNTTATVAPNEPE